jgi:CHRD domain-containing protein
MRTLAILGAASLTLTALGATSSASAAPAMPLNGNQETAPADTDGHGFFTYDIEGTDFCYTLEWKRIEPALAAHIHRAPRGVAGGIVIHLSVGDGSGSRVEECVPISSDLATEITSNPKNFYVNVHNQPFPAGAIRGQLK